MRLDDARIAPRVLRVREVYESLPLGLVKGEDRARTSLVLARLLKSERAYENSGMSILPPGPVAITKRMQGFELPCATAR